MIRIDNLIRMLTKMSMSDAATIVSNLNSFAGDFSGQCRIYNIQEDTFVLDVNENSELDQEDFISPGGNADEYLEEEGFDYYEILNEAENIFKSTGVNISREDNFFEACISPEGNVSGCSVIHYYMNEGIPTLRFSVAVASSSQGGGVGRKLTESIIEQHQGRFMIEAWVINPHMASLLESLGFDGDWSEEDPFMHLS